MSFEIRSFNESAGSTEGPDSGVYNAVVVEVEQPEFYVYPDASLTDEELEAKRKWVTRFVFEIEGDAEWHGTRLRTKRIPFTTLHEKSNNYKLWKALTGESFEPDRKYRPSEAKGRRCQIVVEINARGYSDIVNYLPEKKVRAKTTTVNEIAGDVQEIPF